jgi:hypothetical protein
MMLKITCKYKYYKAHVKLCCILLIYSTAAFAQAPIVSTLQASGVSLTSAQINATVNPNGSTVFVWFEYGTTPALGSVLLPVQDSLSGNNVQAVNGLLTGLLPNTFYYFSITALSGTDTVTGNVVQLYTTDCEIPNCSFEAWDSFFVPQPTGGWSVGGNIQRVSSYNGSYAVEMHGDSGTNNGLAGDITLGSFGGSSSLSGGIPFAALPDSIVFHARYNIVNGDTAYILFMLKKNGVFMDTFFLPIAGSTGGNWVTIARAITYSNSTIPDSMIFGIISTNVFAQNPNFRSVIAVDDIVFTGTNLLLPDWNFEQWDSTLYELPQYWTQGDRIFNSTDGIEISKTTDAYAGRYALMLSNKAKIAIGPGHTSFNSAYYSYPYFPVAGRHTSINGYFKFMPYNGDSISVTVILFAAGTMVAKAFFFIDSPVLSYTPFSKDFTYTSQTLIPDSANLEILFQNHNSSINDSTIAYIDDLSFDGFSITTGESPVIQNGTLSQALSIYPNPASDIVTIHWQGAGKSHLEIFDNKGDLIFADAIMTDHARINSSLFAAGLYVVKVMTSDSVFTGRFGIIK